MNSSRIISATPMQAARFFWLSVVLAVAATRPVLAQTAPNATVVHAKAQLRESYPKFGPSTLVNFKLRAGQVLAVIDVGERVVVKCSKIVSDQEWLQISHGTAIGWVYAGSTSKREHLKLDAGVKVGACSDATGGNRLDALIDGAGRAVLFPTPLAAQEQSGTPAPNSAPVSDTAALLIGLAQLLMLIGSLIAIRKWVFPGSASLTFLSCSPILVILGRLNSEMYVDLIKTVTSSLLGGP